MAKSNGSENQPAQLEFQFKPKLQREWDLLEPIYYSQETVLCLSREAILLVFKLRPGSITDITHAIYRQFEAELD